MVKNNTFKFGRGEEVVNFFFLLFKITAIDVKYGSFEPTNFKFLYAEVVGLTGHNSTHSALKKSL